ncbi:MAG: SGNH/GDSL hydrolase family protein [Verrucomicrobiales bacterium]
MPDPPRFFGFLLGTALLFWSTGTHGAARKILVMGDSQSEEYAFEAGPAPLFSGPDSNLLNANIRNWIEILAAERSSDCSFGSYKSSSTGYSDIRRGGYAYNWSVPAAETGDMVDVIESTLLKNPWYLTSKNQIIDQLETEVAYVVIFLGANDVRSIYGDFYNNTVPSGFNSTLVANLKKAVDFVQAEKSSLRIVVVNIPDPGVTPSKIAAHPDPAKRAAASTRIATLNQSIATMAASEGCALADVMALTELIRASGNFYLNGRQFLKAGHLENPPNYLFAKDGFHPSTVAQALFANAILKAVNTKWNQNIQLLANREILGDVLGLNPDQPLLDWLSSSGSSGGVWGNPDGDSDRNLTEFALGMNPSKADTASPNLFSETRSGQPSLVARFSGARTRDGYLLVTPQESPSPAGPWTNVPSTRYLWLPGGGIEFWLPLSNGRSFLRLAVTPAP